MTAVATLTDPTLLRIAEAAAGLVEGASGSAVADDGTVTIHLIRPCVGKGRGRHVYEATMLKQHAESGHFNDWPMFIDHESPAARRAAGGLPRSIRDVGGRIVETWWDGDVAASGRFGKGAVAAKVLPVPYVQELIRHDPKLVEASINTHATGVKPTSKGGRPAYVVEGFEPEGSVDWVTRAGAGGRVVSLMEAAMDDDADDQIKNLLEGWNDEQIASYLRDERPHLAENLHNDAENGEEDDVKPEELAEAISTHLASDAGKQLITEAFSDAAEPVITEALNKVLPNAIGKAAEVIEESASAAATKAVRMGRLLDKAQLAIAEAKLPDEREMPDRLRQDVLDRIGQPDLDDKKDGDGKVTESAEQQFDVLLEAELKRAAEIAESFGPAPVTPKARRRRTAVTENGAGAEPGKGGAERVQETAEDEVNVTPYRSALQEAGVDFKAAYGVDTSKAKGKDEPKDKDREEDAKATA